MIIMSGSIGAGKSSLTEFLSDHLGTKAYYESVEDNDILPLFYSDPEKYAFLLQVYFLNTRLKSIKAAMVEENNVLDRSIYEDRLFFHMNADMGRASQKEVEVYDDLFQNMMEELPHASCKKAPDLLVHIEVSLETMLKRIERRGRSYEQISSDPALYNYYQQLIDRYEKWFEAYDASPKIKIDGDRYDFVEDVQARKEVLKQIDQELLRLNKIDATQYQQLMSKL